MRNFSNVAYHPLRLSKKMEQPVGGGGGGGGGVEGEGGGDKIVDWIHEGMQ